jgi:hypothetical protein
MNNDGGIALADVSPKLGIGERALVSSSGRREITSSKPVSQARGGLALAAVGNRPT